MEPGQTEFNEKFYEAIRQALPSDAKILYISLTGSRGKNLASQESDYDVRVIILSPYEKYLLQKPRQHEPIKTEFQGITLEGQAIDILKAFDYALDTNPFMLDTFRGIPVYSASDKLIEQLRKVFIEGFLPIVPMNAFQGLTFTYLKKGIRDKEGKYSEKASAKAIVEPIFLALEVRCLLTDKQIIDYPTIDSLMEFAGEDEEFMKTLVETRRRDRMQEILIPEAFIKIVENTLERAQEFIKNFPKEKKDKIFAKREELKKEIDQICLDLIISSKA